MGSQRVGGVGGGRVSVWVLGRLVPSRETAGASDGVRVAGALPADSDIFSPSFSVCGAEDQNGMSSFLFEKGLRLSAFLSCLSFNPSSC